ncbi:MAG: aminoglycoside N(3)-acetyltransferase [Bacillus sp. (in: firmicutes)]
MIQKQQTPNTIPSLTDDFRNIGIREGMTIIVHSSMKAMGWVCGGPVSVVKALMAAVGEEGTIVMPTHSADLSEPSYWDSPPVPPEWWDTIRKEMPPFDPQTTPTYEMGKIVECFRTFDGVKRSNHPVASFAAWGKYSDYITDKHSLEYCFGEHSPLQRLYDVGAFILLIGVDYENNTSLHLAECYAESCFTCEHGSPIMENGKRIWKTYTDFIYDIEQFNDIGREFEKRHDVSVGYIGNAISRLIPQAPLVDFAASWLSAQKQEK